MVVPALGLSCTPFVALHIVIIILFMEGLERLDLPQVPNILLYIVDPLEPHAHVHYSASTFQIMQLNDTFTVQKRM